MSIYTVKDKVKPHSVERRDIKKLRGCDIYFSRVGRCEFEGRSASGTCKSENGTVIISRIDVNEYILSTLTEGFVNGSKVWGQNGPYRFNRIRDI